MDDSIFLPWGTIVTSQIQILGLYEYVVLFLFVSSLYTPLVSFMSFLIITLAVAMRQFPREL